MRVGIEGTRTAAALAVIYISTSAAFSMPNGRAAGWPARERLVLARLVHLHNLMSAAISFKLMRWLYFAMTVYGNYGTQRQLNHQHSAAEVGLSCTCCRHAWLLLSSIHDVLMHFWHLCLRPRAW